MFLCSGFTIETLKRETEISDDQLDTTVEETDLPKLSSYFDNTGDYVEMLGLSPGQQTDVMEEKARTAMNQTQATGDISPTEGNYHNYYQNILHVKILCK